MKILISSALLLGSMHLYAKPKVEIGVLLDTSGSMQGLINQVRDGLWSTINSFGTIKKNGEVADLKLALYEFGSGVVDEEARFIQQLAPLTTDHTLIAEKLFQTKAQGSEEFYGEVIDRAVNDLNFSGDDEDFKSLIVAGNETIYQGNIDALDAAQDSANKGVIVNPIFAGEKHQLQQCHFCTDPRRSETVLNPLYKEFLSLAHAGLGEALNIDHNRAVQYIESPYDERIVELTKLMNTTYIPFGVNGQSEYDRMIDLDRQVSGAGNGGYLNWGNYRPGRYGRETTAKWDLVTAMMNENFDINTVDMRTLPKHLQRITRQELVEEVNRLTRLRKLYEDESKTLREKREEYVRVQKEEQGQQDALDFEKAIKEILLKQLKEKGFTVS